MQDTALIDLINRVRMHYSGAEVSAAALCGPDSNLEEGKIHLYDSAQIYSFNNTLYTIRMNGRQLKKVMEWTAGYFNTINPENPEITADPAFPYYNYLMFDGVNYEINLAEPPGKRIQKLTWPDGRSVEDKDTFTLAVNNYNGSSNLLAEGVIFSEDDMPEIVESDVRSDLGGIREMITDYIIHVKKGVLTPEYDRNRRIVRKPGGS